jgi:hypothetical protein
VLETYDPVEERQHSAALLKDPALKLHVAGVGPTIKKELEVGTRLT